MLQKKKQLPSHKQFPYTKQINHQIHHRSQARDKPAGGHRPSVLFRLADQRSCLGVMKEGTPGVLNVRPAEAKVGQVNGSLIRKLGSLHASAPGHYSSLIGGLLPKGKCKMIGSLAVGGKGCERYRNTGVWGVCVCVGVRWLSG